MNSKLDEVLEKIRNSGMPVQEAKDFICNGLIEKLAFAQMFDLSYNEIVRLIKQYLDVEEFKTVFPGNVKKTGRLKVGKFI